jgi:ABC-type lipoprotein release transport system permease subunit
MNNWVERQKNLIDFTLSALWRRKGKHLALLLVYTFVIFALASVMLFTEALKKEASLLLKDAPEMTVQKMMAGRHDLIPLSYVESIQKIRGVVSVAPRLWGYYFDPVVGANYTLMVPEKEAPGPGKVVVGRGLSRSRQAYEGDILSFRAYTGEPITLKIQKVLSGDSELIAADLILLSGEDFKNFFGFPEGVATDLALRIRNPRELTTIAFKISDLLPDTRIILREEVARTYDSVFDWRGGIIIVTFSMAGLAFIILAWEKASGLSAEEKREIGILKAIGWETSDVLLLKFWEGVVVSLSSFLMGMVLAYLHVFFSSATLFAHALKGWSILYPEFKLIPFIDPYQVVVLFFFTVVPYTVATIIPSWRAATIDPDTVMRA